MLHLVQSNTTNVRLTLNESITLTGTPVYFLFNFKNETTQDNFYFTATDVSTATTRYNEFQLTLTGSSNVNLTAGTISMNPDGRWTYKVYEQYSNSNLALSGTSGTIIEKGLVTLSGTSTHDIVENYYSGASQTYNYYVR